MIGLNLVLTGIVVFFCAELIARAYDDRSKSRDSHIVAWLGLAGIGAVVIGIIMWIWGL